VEPNRLLDAPRPNVIDVPEGRQQDAPAPVPNRFRRVRRQRRGWWRTAPRWAQVVGVVAVCLVGLFFVLAVFVYVPLSFLYRMWLANPGVVVALVVLVLVFVGSYALASDGAEDSRRVRIPEWVSVIALVALLAVFIWAVWVYDV